MSPVSETITPGFLVDHRGVTRELGAFVVAARFDRAGRTAAFALGDGTLRLVDLADRETWREVTVHDGGVLALTSDGGARGFVSVATTERSAVSRRTTASATSPVSA